MDDNRELWRLRIFFFFSTMLASFLIFTKLYEGESQIGLSLLIAFLSTAMWSCWLYYRARQSDEDEEPGQVTP